MDTSLIRIKKALDENFCLQLEHHLSKAFSSSLDKKLRWIWCDGIQAPEIDANVLEIKSIKTNALIGENGQGNYVMTIKLGERTLQRCLTDQRLEEYLPDEDLSDWVNLDRENCRIELRLH